MPGTDLRGMFIGTCIARDDPQGLRRIQFEIPGLVEGGSSPWAMPLGGGGFKDQGGSKVPKLKAEVAIWFNQGDIDHPYYQGAQWGKPGGVSEVPQELADPDVSMLYSDDRFRVFVDERDGQQGFTILDLRSGQKIEFNSDANVLSVIGTTVLKLKADGMVDIEAASVQINGRQVLNIQNPI